jgi:hypothetical protein
VLDFLDDLQNRTGRLIEGFNGSEHLFSAQYSAFLSTLFVAVLVNIKAEAKAE